MIQIRRAQSRGHADHGWLQTWHSFSFADYYDLAHMGWGPLRVINEDIVAPGQGFPTHGHRDMEIITVIVSGMLEHKDSMGNGARIAPYEAQYMSAGPGITHSEFNPDAEHPVHLLQIWIMPPAQGLPSSYDQIEVPPELMRNRAAVLASPDGRDGSIRLHQDAAIYRVQLDPGKTHTQHFAANRYAYVQVIAGEVDLNGQALSAGDGARLRHETVIDLIARNDSNPCDFLIFDLPPAAP